jgi:1-acyl-sn-glycerol-3-phosphate acyltransferase
MPAGRLVASVFAFTARLVSGANAQWVVPFDGEKQRIYYANHTSHLDAIVIWSLLPKQTRPLTRPIAAADYWTRGRIKPLLSRDVFNAILIPRRAPGVHDPETVRAAARAAVDRTAEGLGDRYSAIIFPEGTRGDGEQLGPFKVGLYYLCARLPNVELVPVYVENLNRILPKGSIVPVPLLTRVTFGEPIRVIEGEERDDFLDRARTAMLALRAPE